MSWHTSRSLARVGLLGNPSDGYGGRVIAMTLPQFAAEVTVHDQTADWDTGGVALFEATVAALAERRPELIESPARLTLATTIPRQVGLSGSSAIIIAALRALADRSGHTWELVELAKVALEVETEVLGWAAGPQDRVVQAYEGVVDMDFTEPWQAASYQRLDASKLPSLFVAWNQSMSSPSDIAHSTVRDRWLANDPVVISVMDRFAQLAVEGRAALDAGTAARDWPGLLDEAFALRSQIWDITSVDTALVQTGRSHGAGVAFAGSGGAVVGTVPTPDRAPTLAASYAEIGAGFTLITP